MFENEEPRHRPVQEKPSEVLRIFPQVPELTIIGSENKINTRNGSNNFLQRAINIPQNITSKQKSAVKSPMINQFPSSSMTQSTSNINTQFKPQVPDLSILDDQSKIPKNSPQSRTTSSNERVFTESYKEMLVNSHDQFLKQLGRENDSNSGNVQNSNDKKRSSPFFSSNAGSYKQNPLAKYAPKPNQCNYNANIESPKEKNLNSSSILVDIKSDSPVNKKFPIEKNEEEEVTFKKVAEMLSEIQKLVIPNEKTLSGDLINLQDNSERRNTTDILRQLAKAYLTPEELIKYEVDKELEELDNNSNSFI